MMEQFIQQLNSLPQSSDIRVMNAQLAEKILLPLFKELCPDACRSKQPTIDLVLSRKELELLLNAMEMARQAAEAMVEHVSDPVFDLPVKQIRKVVKKIGKQNTRRMQIEEKVMHVLDDLLSQREPIACKQIV